MSNTIAYIPQRYEADGVTKTFAFNWKILEVDDVVVIIEEDGVQTVLDYGDDYSVTFVSGSSGGSITTVLAYDDCDIIIVRSREYKQGVELTTARGFQAEAIENDIADNLSMQIQQLSYDAQRFIKNAIGSTLDISIPLPSAGKSLIWNEEENSIINSEVNVDEIQTYVDEANAAADIAQAAVGNIPTPVASNYLRQKSDVTGLEYRTPAQVASDVNPYINEFVGTCSTAAATAEKAVTVPNFTLTTNKIFWASFDNANTATTPTINVNEDTALSLKNMQGDALSYIPANIPLDFRYDGTDLIGLYTNTFAVMPDYSNPVSKAWGIDHTAECDGCLYVGATDNVNISHFLQINDLPLFTLGHGASADNIFGTFVPMPKNTIYKATGGSLELVLTFYPLKGAI